MTDCSAQPYGNTEPGIVFSIDVFSIDDADMNTKVVYTTDTGIPKPSLTSTQSAGAAVIFNVKPGSTVIHALFKGTAQPARVAIAFRNSVGSKKVSYQTIFPFVTRKKDAMRVVPAPTKSQS